MKHNKTPKPVQRFKIKFPLVILFLSVAVYVLCALGITASIWRIVKFGIRNFNDVTKYPFLLAVCAFCIVLITSILTSSYYFVQDGKLVTQFGFIKTSYTIKEIKALVLDCDSQKLTVTFENGQYMTLTVNADWNELLVRDILNENSDIDYSFTLSDVPEEKENNEKK